MTGFSSNIDKFITHFENLTTKNLDATDALTAGVNAAKGEMQFRIFNKGQDSQNKSLGKYRGKRANKFSFKDPTGKKKLAGTRSNFTPYEIKRLKAGRQVRYKDLEFTGDLRRSMKVLIDRNHVVCAITNTKQILIAEGQEEDLGTDIFLQSEGERETMILNISETLKQLFNVWVQPQ